MKKSRTMEIIGILSLSLLLTSAMVISGAVPAMLKFYNGYSRADVEAAVATPAMAITIIIALTPFITKILKERILICAGLIMVGVFGVLPAFIPQYNIMLVSRVALGVGIGLVNTHAVSMIGERFEGNLRARLQGVRVSFESLGQAALTLIAGQLLIFGWKKAFMVYLVAFVVLFLYLVFVPTTEKVQEIEKEKNMPKCQEKTGS